MSGSPKPGSSFSGFLLLERLGSGGNADVWRAQRADLGEIALKILKSKRVHSEPHERFRREVSALRQMGNRPGVLPLLDSSVPEQVARGEKAWLAMPVAEPLGTALRDASTQLIIESAAKLADTLASLQDDLQLFHRDLKPNNLYWHEGVPVVGDFGLVALPDAGQLTVNDKPLGPANFVPYEMLNYPADADPATADVYSFAKTLWVLLTGQHWPPGGEQSASNSGFSIRQYRAHPRLRELDELIDRCTKFTPTDRPSMRQVADDLQAWLNLDDGPGALPDLSAYGRRLREAAEPHISERQRRERLEEVCGELGDELSRRLKPVVRLLREEYPLVEADVWDQTVENLLGYTVYCGSPGLVSQEARATRLVAGDETTADLALTIGWCISVTDDGLVHAKGSLELGPRRTMGTLGYETIDKGSAPAGSVKGKHAVEELANDIIIRVPDWFARFADAVERHRSGRA